MALPFEPAASQSRCAGPRSALDDNEVPDPAHIVISHRVFVRQGHRADHPGDAEGAVATQRIIGAGQSALLPGGAQLPFALARLLT